MRLASHPWMPAPSGSVLPAGAASTSSEPVVSGGGSAEPTKAVPGMPVWQQLMVNYGFTRLYAATVGPMLRQTSEKVLGQEATPAYKPPMTPGFLARDVLSTGLSFVAGTQIMKLLNGGAAGGANLLTTSGGVAGATAGAGAGALTLAAMKKVAGHTLAMTVAMTAIDALMANKLGPAVEGAVNSTLGIKQAATVKSQKDGTVPTNTVKTSPEQFVRNTARSLLSSLTYSTALATVGATVARAVSGGIAGPAGVLAAGVGAALVSGAITHVEDLVIGKRAADLAQDAYRSVVGMTGRTLPKKEDADIYAVPGDRVAWAVGSVALPYATAMASGQHSQFLSSIIPRGR